MRLRPVRQSLAVLGVALGVAVFLAVKLLDQSALQSARSEFESVLGRDRAVVSAGGSDFHAVLARQLRDIPGVLDSNPYLQRSVLLKSSDGTALKLLLVGIPERLAARFGEKLNPGILRPSAEWLARRGYASGDLMKLTGMGASQSVQLGEPLSKIPLVKFHGGDVAFVDLSWFAELLGVPGKANRMDVAIAEGANTEVISKGVADKLGAAFELRRPDENSEGFGHALNTYRIVLNAYGWIALLIGAVSAAGATAVSISERRESIGLLRALGSSRSTIAVLCLAESLVSSFLGVLVGIPGGFVAASLLAGSVTEAMSALSGATMSARAIVALPLDLLLAAGIGMIAGPVGAMIPAWRATRIMPLDALRPVVTVAGPVGRWLSKLASGTGRFDGLLRLGLLNVSRGAGRTLPIALVLVAGFGLFAFFSTVSSSLKETVSARYARLYRPDLIVFPRIWAMGARDGVLDGSLKDKISSIKGVEQAVGIRELRADFEGEPILLRAYDEPKAIIDFKMVDAADRKVTEAAADLFYSSDVSVFISTSFAKKFGKKRGDKFLLLSPSGKDKARIIGSAYDLSFAGGVLGISRTWYQALWADSSLSELMVQVDRNFEAEAIAAEIRGRYGDDYGILVESHEAFRAAILGAVDRAFLHLRILEWAALLLGALVLLNTMLAEIVSRRRELGLLRAIGMSRSQLEKLVLIESSLQGLGAAVLGCAVGGFLGALAVEKVISPVLGWSPELSFSPMLVVSGLLLAGVVSCIAGYFPARHAGNLEIHASLDRV